MMLIGDGQASVAFTCPEEILQDELIAMTTFISVSKQNGVSDELIEQSLVKLICDAFENYNNGNVQEFKGNVNRKK